MTTQISPYMSLEQLVSRLRSWEESKHDFVVDARQLSFDASAGEVRIVPAHPTVGEWMELEGHPVEPWAVGQLSGRMDPEIPVQYLKKLVAQRPSAAAELMRQTRPGKRWFVRMLEGRIRAVLSDQYRVIDHLDMAQAALQAVRDAGGSVVYASLDERKMRLSFTNQETWDVLADAEKNTGRGSHHFQRFGNDQEADQEPGKVHPLVTVSNSETGDGGASVRYGISSRPLREYRHHRNRHQSGPPRWQDGCRNLST